MMGRTVFTMPRPIIQELETYGPDRSDALSPAQAREYTQAMTRANHENFSVASRFLPRELRDDFHAVYAFCRWADDLGDERAEGDDPSRGIELLEWWSDELERCYRGEPRHPVFVALHETIQKHDLPQQPFADLISAFTQDQYQKRYETWDQVLDYCTRSANPVGRLVLRLYGTHDDEADQLADATCTALQLANFWQDVRRDILERDRVYIPADLATVHGLELEAMVRLTRLDEAVRCAACGTAALANSGLGKASGGLGELMPAYRATLHALVQKTWPLFEEGRQLWPVVGPRVRSDLKLYTLGGETVLRKIERLRYDTWTQRPVIGNLTKAKLMLRVLAGRVFGG